MKMNIQKKGDQYSIESWTIDQLINALEEKPTKGKIISVPRFQRNLVWSNRQQREFIQSVKEGLPFGALLMWAEGTTKEEIQKYTLLDGLQRTSTIRKHVNDPNGSFEPNEIEDDLLFKLCGILNIEKNNENNEHLRANISKWIKRIKGFEESDGFSSYELAKSLREEYKNKSSNGEVIGNLYEELMPFLSKVKQDADISKVKVPIIFYFGSKDNLPAIFENLNSKGTKLTKYQIYAATWKNEEIIITNKEIIKLIQEKYQNLIDDGYQIENYDEDNFSVGPFNIFEYVFGLGKLVTKKYPSLFGESDSQTSDSIGFNLSAVCLGLKISEIVSLPKKIKSLNEEFEKALFASIDFVFGCLKPYITLRANRKKGQKLNPRPRIYHTEYQIVSLISKIFHSKYSQRFEEKKSWKVDKRKYQNTIPIHYLYDIIRDVWRGSGDKRISEMLKSDEYLIFISKERWDSAFIDWLYTNQLVRKEKSRVRIRDADYLFVNFLYADTLSYKEVESPIEYNIEHMIPIERLKEIAGDGISMSAVSNLCILPEKLNKEKKGLTIYEYYEKQVESKKISKEEAKKTLIEIEKYTWTEEAEFKFMGDLNKENYEGFLQYRMDKLIAKFYEKNNIEKP